MFGKAIPIFKIFGFEVKLDASWIVIAALVTWSLAAGVFPAMYPGLPRATFWRMGVFGALGFFCSIVIHELCHALVASRYGLTIKGITLFIFGGVAELGDEPRRPGAEFWVAIAGPICSILLGFLYFFMMRLARWQGSPEAAVVLAYLAWVNWLLAGFNLVPAFPLDGGRMLRAAIWKWNGDFTRATRIASTIGSAFGISLMAFGILELLSGRLVGAVWYFLIGSFLRGASQSSYEYVVLRSLLAGEPVSRFMRRDPVRLTPEMTLRQLVEDFVYRYDVKYFPVVSDSDELIGCVSAADIKKVPRHEWDRHSVAELIQPCTEANSITPETDALKALSKIRETGGRGLFVTDHRHLLAVISPRDLINFLAAKLEMEGQQAPGLLAHLQR